MSGVNRKGVISIWIGIAPEYEKFGRYFENSEVIDAESPIKKDLGIRWIDADFFSTYYTIDGTPQPITNIIDEIPFNECFEKELTAKCLDIGIEKANAYFSMTDFYFQGDGGSQKTYGGLYFVGTYPYDTNKLSEAFDAIGM